MSYFTDVKCEIKKIVEEAYDSDDVFSIVPICNVAGVHLTLNILPEKRMYEIILNEVDYSSLEFRDGLILSQPGDRIRTVRHDSLDSAIEDIASLICANKFL